ncbi:MAG: DNA internalization-related competence protein ComEC/Rec2 [Clostridia bacterium]|nr:DNA internalization-related competence protein ComEC/Rec2 [Clostridia bacterium]
MAGRTGWLEGRVASFPNPDRDPDARESILLELDDGVGVHVVTRSGHVGYGDRIRIHATLSQPDPARSPGGFDQRAWTAGKGIHLVAESDGNAPPAMIAQASPWHPARVAWEIRQRMYRTFQHQVGQADADVLAALLFGDQGGLEDSLAQAFRRAGLSHVLSVSGSHLSMVAAPLQWIIGPSGPGRKGRLALHLLILISFSAAAGFQPAVLRSLGMNMVSQWGRSGRRLADAPSALGACVAVMIAVAPWLSRNTGFLASVAATAGILVIGSYKAGAGGKRKRLSEGVRVAVGAQIGAWPVLAARVRRIPLQALPAGMAALPLVGALIPVGLLLGLSGTTRDPGMPAWIAAWLLTALRTVVSLAASCNALRLLMPFWTQAAGVAVWLALAAAGAGSRITRTRLRAVSGCLVCLFLAQWGIARLDRPELTLIFADVGQGDCSLIRTRDGTTLLIDCGTAESYENVVLPMLEHEGVFRIDMCILTHGHADHAGGFTGLLSDRLANVFAYAPTLEAPSAGTVDDTWGEGGDLTPDLLETARASGTDVVQLRSGDCIAVGEIRIDILHPPEGLTAGNEASLVLLVRYGDFRILIQGDAGTETEHILATDGRLCDVDILRVGHHGSSGATSDEFLDRIRPELAVVSVGRNRYGHPSEALLDRLNAHGIQTLRTDQDGSVIVRMDQGRMRIDRSIGEEPD